MSIDQRAHLVDTAMKLFYQKGYHATGTEEIAAESSVNEEILASYFGSKDDLILATMERRDEQFREWLSVEVKKRGATPREKLLSVFDILQGCYEGPGFHGCMFINATVKFSKPEDPVHTAAAKHKQLLYDYLRELTEALHVENSLALAKQLVLLMEGAIVTTQVTGSPDAARQARKAAEILVTQANKSTTKRQRAVYVDT